MCSESSFGGFQSGGWRFIASASGRMAEVAKEEAMKLVKRLSELQLLEVCAGLNLKPKDGKTDRKKALKNCLVRYLESEELEDSADEGLAVFEKVASDMRALIEEDLEEEEKSKLKDLKKRSCC